MPTSPTPGTTVSTLVVYVLLGKSDGAPIGCHSNGTRLNSGPSANPSAGSVKAATVIAPAPLTARPIRRRRVTVSPSNAPGMLRSAVYLGLASLWRSGTGGKLN
ncbi:MAG: hypothetical protein ACJ76X_16565 [Solirubrobacteraceae bacterium]